MSPLSKKDKDLVKKGQDWKCGNRYCNNGKPRSIKSGGQIHHKDGNHDNNDIRNLVALCMKCHQAENKKQAQLKKQGKPFTFPVSFKI